MTTIEEEYEALFQQNQLMAKCLDEIAEAVKGKPPEGARWGWDDLPEKVRELANRDA